MNTSRRLDQWLAAGDAYVPRGGSFDLVDGQSRAAQGDEAACNLRGAVAQCRLRSHGVLAEIDRPLALGLEDVASQRYWNRARRSTVAAALDLRPEVEQDRVSAL